MALSTRELFLVLRARDEASRVLRTVSREMLATGKAAQAAAAQAEVAALKQQMQMMRTNGASASMLQTQRQRIKAAQDEADALKEASDKNQRFGKTMFDLSTAATTAGISLVAVGVAGLYGLGKAAQAAVEYNRTVALTKTQVDDVTVSTKALGDMGLRIAKEFPVAFEQIQPALYDVFSSTNANIAEAEIMMRGFAKAAVAGQTDIQTAARGTIAVMNTYNIPFEQTEKILDIQFKLVQKGVGTYEDFANVIGRVIPSAKKAGQNFETVAGGLAYLTRNGLSAAMAAASLGRAFDALSNPQTVEKLKNIGISVQDVHGDFLPLTDILDKINQKMKGMSEVARSQFLNELFKGSGGTIQAFRALIPLLDGTGKELGELKGFVNDMSDSTGTLNEKFQEMNATDASKIQQLKNDFQVLAIQIGTAVLPHLVKFVAMLMELVKWWDSLSPKQQNMIVQVALIGSVVAIVVGIFLIFVGVIAGVVGAVSFLGATFFTVVGIVLGVVAVIGALVIVIISLWKKSEGFRDFWIGLGKAIADFWNSISGPFIAAFNLIGETWNKFFPIIKEVWDNIVTASKDAWENQLKPAFEQFKEAWNQLGPVLDVIKMLFIAIGIVIGVIVAVALMLIVGLIKGIAGFIGPFITGIVSFIKGIIEIISGIINFFIDLFTGKWSKLGDDLRQIWNGLWDAIVGTLVNFIAAIWGFVKGLVEGVVKFFVWLWNKLVGGSIVPDMVNGIIQWFRNLLQQAVQLASDIVNGILNWFKGIGEKVSGFFSGAGQWLLDAGRRIIQGLVDGIESMIHKVGEAISKAAQIVKDHMPFSPAKRGPLSGSGSPLFSGRSIVRMMADGMLQEVGYLTYASRIVAGSTMAGAGIPGIITGNQTGGVGFGASGNTRTFNQNIYVTTQEIDPRVHAAQLGFELDRRTI